jgi:hypothetical protein
MKAVLSFGYACRLNPRDWKLKGTVKDLNIPFLLY